MKPIKPLSIIIKSRTRSDGTTTVIASTPTPDRYNDVVASDWKLEQYMANPVVQFGHRYDIPPVGRTEQLKIDEKTGNLIATIKWDDVPTNPLGQTVAAQFKSKMMQAVSVGFQPSSSVERSKLPTDHPAHGETGMYFTGNKLLEISAVPVPANGEALALRSMGLDQAKSITNVEETDDSYIITYAKYPAEDAPEDGPEEDVEEAVDEEEDEDAGYDEDEDEDRQPFEDEDEDEADEDDEDDEDDEADEDEASQVDDEDDDDEDEDEAPSKAMLAAVRQAVLELIGHDPEVRRALSGTTKRRKKTPTNALADLFGIDN